MRFIAVSFCSSIMVVGCSSRDFATSEGAEPIVGGVPASELAEAALIDTDSFLCSGAVIAPRVVLTAGHCIPDATSWTVTVPFANNQRATAHAFWTEYVDGGDYVNPDTVDVALLILDTPINLASYPRLAKSAVPNGTSAINVGRIRNGSTSSSALFKGTSVHLERGDTDGFPYAYEAKDVIEEGDSGGPVYVGTGSSRMIVAVNSGGGGGSDILARVDAVYQKIQAVIAANGGGGPTQPRSDCWSNTLGKNVSEMTCVQSKSDSVWYQCKASAWYHGGDAQDGPFGPCVESVPLL